MALWRGENLLARKTDGGDSRGGHSPRDSATSPQDGAPHNFLFYPDEKMCHSYIHCSGASRATRFAIGVTDFIFFGQLYHVSDRHKQALPLEMS